MIQWISLEKLLIKGMGTGMYVSDPFVPIGTNTLYEAQMYGLQNGESKTSLSCNSAVRRKNFLISLLMR
jgi:hypothetical protein